MFNTPAGELVEKATSTTLENEDWGLNMQVCDAVNSYADGAKDTVKAIKKRLSSNKNFLQVTLTLSLLEGCVKNCGSHFHVLVTSKDFCGDALLKIIQPKNNPPVFLQQRVLGLIKQWAEAFGSNPQMNGVKQVYDDLKEKGFDFPDTEPLEGILPSTTAPPPQGRPASQHSRSRDHVRRPEQARHAPNNHYGQASSANPTQAVGLVPEQIAKLRKDLEIVKGNATVFSEMLTELNPAHCDSSEYELMKELNRTCRAMQQRIVELLGEVANEDITVELLKVNDDLNNVFLRYDRFEKFRQSDKDAVKKPPDVAVTASNNCHGDSAAAQSSSLGMVEPPPSYSDTVQPTPEVNDLIDLGNDDVPAVSPVVSKETRDAGLSKEFGDINLNSRNATTAAPASYPFLSEELSTFDQPPEEVAQLGSSEQEIEQWLAADAAALGISSSPEHRPVEENAVTDEFSAFLNERATTANNLPSIQSPQSS